MKRHQNPRKTLAFVFIASLLMVASDFLFFPMKFHAPEDEPPPAESAYQRSESRDYEAALEREKAEGRIREESFPAPSPPGVIPDNGARGKITNHPASLKLPEVPAPGAGKPEIAIIIDDMGMDRKRSREAMDLPAPVTLAFLPYAPGLPAITAEARAKGHELLIHMPMEAIDRRENLGPLALRENMTEESFELAMQKMFESFDGYAGVNNHMGSRLTQDPAAMAKVMKALKARGLIFVDSRTAPGSIAEEEAAEYGLRHAGRDVFLDNEDTREYVENSLRHLEEIARKRGYAVAIGHPRDSTIEVLKEWIPAAQARGVAFVKASAVAR